MNDILLATASLIAGGIISYWISLRHLPSKNIHHFIKDFDLIDKSQLGISKDLELRFQNRNIDEIRLCRVLLWNSGSECFHSADIAKNDSMRIVVSGAKGLSLLSTFQNRGAVGLTANSKGNEVDFVFDLLDEGDWIELRFIYDRDVDVEKSKVQAPKLLGSVAGVPNGITYLDLEDHLSESHWTGRLVALSISGMSLVMVIAAYSSFVIQEMMPLAGKKATVLEYAVPYGMVIISVIMVFMSMAYIYSRWRVTNIIVPKSLKKAIMK